MRLCVFSDVHGNAEAFSVAQPLMLREEADAYLFLGDICGYYFDQLKVFPLLRQLPRLSAVLGNHDAMFLQILNGADAIAADYRTRYGLAMDNLLKQDHKELTLWLSDLPEVLSLRDGNVLAMHGSPSDRLTGYIYPDSPLDAFEGLSADIILCGHSHYPMMRTDSSGRLFVNPGSIGQPRGQKAPSFAVVDCDRREVVFRTFEYDREGLIRRIDAVGDSTPYLKRILEY